MQIERRFDLVRDLLGLQLITQRTVRLFAAVQKKVLERKLEEQKSRQ